MSVRRYVQLNGQLYERGTEPQSAAPMVMPDIAPYRSMITGELIGSRSRHREHLKAYGYEEVGNDSSLGRQPTEAPDVNPQGRKELIRKQIDRMTHEQFRSALRREIQHIRWNSRKD